jgi:acyl-CoA thioester hydrolase
VSDDFRHRTPVQVRFRDTDAFGHVNNAVFFSYAELARIRYFLDVLKPAEPFDRMPLILARAAVDFRSPVMFGEEVVVQSRVDRIGRSSISMSHRMTAGADERLVGEVESVLVTYDYAATRPMPVPNEWRRLMAEHEGRQLEAEADAPRRTLAAAR